MEPLIPNLFARLVNRARLTPERSAHVTAAADGSAATVSTTYRDLLTRAYAVADHLRRRLGSDPAPVVVLGHKEPEMLAGFLGAVGSGRPYIPLDDSLPGQRIGHIRDASGASLLLTPADIGALPLPPAEEALAHWSAAPPLDAASAFYIIFTSGSTGEPKGVIITTANLDAFATWMLAEQDFAAGNEVFLNQAPFSFDLSVMDLYLSLVTGGTLHSITRDEIADFRRLFAALTASGVTTWVSTPSFVQLCLAERSFAAARLPALRRFLFCGETLFPETAARLCERFPAAQVWNTYGPTEATVATTSIRITPQIAAAGGALPIGRPRPGTEIRLLADDDPTGGLAERGEIVIAGPNVSPGYVGQPELTDRVFSGSAPRRAYRTGDWGRRQGDLLFFEGRRDAQIKLHGYRIELADIETNLSALPGVRDCAVLPIRKRGVIQFVAAFVTLAGESPSTAASADAASDRLRGALAERLPVYMIPRKIYFLTALPITPNGKADRRRLAEIAESGGPLLP
jgi:D-alanine--poly(phosphoribitol) ligase subunit 1